MGARNPLSDDALARLKALDAENYSASAISRMLFSEFGEYRSRCAVIGIIYRLGLHKDRPRRPSPTKAKQPRDKQPRERRSPNKAAKTPKAVAPPPPPPPSLGEGISITDPRLRDHHCRQVLGYGEDGRAVFCGASKTRGAFCGWHGRINYQPASARKEAA